MIHNTNKHCPPNTPSLSHLVSSITGGAPAVFSSAHKSENTHLLLFHRHVLSFRDAIGRAMKKHPMLLLLLLNSRTRAHALHPETRRASSRHHPRATGCDAAKDALKTNSDICALFSPMFDSKGRIVPKISTNLVNENHWRSAGDAASLRLYKAS